MAVAFDDSASGGGYPQNLVTVSGHTLGSGDNRIVIVGIILLGPSHGGVWDEFPNYGGETMTLLDQEVVTYYGRVAEPSPVLSAGGRHARCRG